MPETEHAQSHVDSIQGALSDEHAFTQVEKWMAIIRELSRKPRDGRAEASKAPAAGEGGLLWPEL